MAVYVATGTTLAFSSALDTNTFDGYVLSIEFPNVSRAKLQSSHFGTTTAHTYLFGKLYEAGECNVELFFDINDSSTIPPFTSSTPQTFTITAPSADTITLSGVVTSFSITMRLEEIAVCSMGIGITGALGGTFLT